MYYFNQNKYKNDTHLVLLNQGLLGPAIKYTEGIDCLLKSTKHPLHLNSVHKATEMASMQCYDAATSSVEPSSGSQSQTNSGRQNKSQSQAHNEASSQALVSWSLYDLLSIDVTTIMVWNEAQDHVVLLSNNNGEMIIERGTEVSHVSLVGYIGTNNDLFDVLAIIGHIIDQKPLSGGSLLSADINQDGSINLFDVLQLVEQIIGSGQPTGQRIVAANGELVSTIAGNSPQYRLIGMGDADQTSVILAAVEPTTTITHGAFAFEVTENSSFVAAAKLQDTAISLAPDYQLTGVDANLFELLGSDISF